MRPSFARVVGTSVTRSFLSVIDQDLGFRPENAVAIRIDPSTKFTTNEAGIAYFDDALRRVRTAPGIESAGLTDVLPMGFNRRWGVQTPEMNEARKPSRMSPAITPTTPVTIASAIVSYVTSAPLRAAMSAVAAADSAAVEAIGPTTRCFEEPNTA